MEYNALIVVTKLFTDLTRLNDKMLLMRFFVILAAPILLPFNALIIDLRLDITKVLNSLKLKA